MDETTSSSESCKIGCTWTWGLGCLAITASLLWGVWEMPLTPLTPKPVFFSAEKLSLPKELSGAGSVRLVHFWDPSCPCNVGNLEHLEQLVQQFGPRGVDFYSVQHRESFGHLPASLSSIRPLTGLEGADQLPASPAVAIWDTQGALAYFGPYSEDAACTSENSFVEPVLNALLGGQKVQATAGLAVACFCDWKP